MSRIVITPAEAADVYGYDYQYSNFYDKLLATPDTDEIPLQMLLSTEAMIDATGRYHDLSSIMLDRDYLYHWHPIYRELQLDFPHIYGVSFGTGHHSVIKDMDTFEFLDPEDELATDILLSVEFERDGSASPMDGMQCDFAKKFSAKFFCRYLPKDQSGRPTSPNGSDIWIIPRHELFDQDCCELAALIRRTMADDSVESETYALTAPIYRGYMEHQLTDRLRAVDPRGCYSVELHDNHADIMYTPKFRRFNSETGKYELCSGGSIQTERCHYTLDGAQRFALLIAQVAARNGTPDTSQAPAEPTVDTQPQAPTESAAQEYPQTSTDSATEEQSSSNDYHVDEP